MSPAMISSDNHVIEPPDLWQSRLPTALRDRGPRVVEDGGEQWWVVRDQRTLSFAGGAQTGDRFTAPAELRTGARFEEVRRGGYDPTAHVRDNADDGVGGAVLYPTEGLMLYTQADRELLEASCRAYNDWLAEFCAAEPARLRGVAMLCTDDVTQAVGELTRAHDLGLGGALIPTAAAPEHRYDDADYEPLWEAAAGLGMPLTMHLGANRVGAGGVDPNLAKIRPSYFTMCDAWVRTSIADLVYSGVFDRHPSLRVGVIEHDIGWIPYFLERLDYTYFQRHGNKNYYRFQTAERPTEFWHRNVFCSFQDDDLGIRERHTIGVQTLTWGSDYPHTESTFPRSRQIMSERLAGVPAEERDAILWGNVARLYGFDTTEE